MSEGSGDAAGARMETADALELLRRGTIEVEGRSGGGLVTVRLTAKGALKGLKIDPSLIKPDEAEILEDLVVAAHADAKAKAEAASTEKMKELTGGLALPPGLKLF